MRTADIRDPASETLHEDEGHEASRALFCVGRQSEEGTRLEDIGWQSVAIIDDQPFTHSRFEGEGVQTHVETATPVAALASRTNEGSRSSRRKDRCEHEVPINLRSNYRHPLCFGGGDSTGAVV
jgi:hypothetical protein